MDMMQEYQKWVALSAGDEHLSAELKAIKNDPRAIEDRFYTELSFGTGGMRGVMGAGINRINVFTIRRAAAGLADELLSHPVPLHKSVVIAFDSRLFSNLFAKETALVMAARGIKALLFESLRPVPVLSYAVRHLHASAGVVITASHNPPRYNGFKAYGADGAQLSPEAADQVTKHIRALDYADCQPMNEEDALQSGKLAYIGAREVDDDYNRMVLDLLIRPELVEKEGGKLNIVYTPLHGAGNVPVRRALREAGITRVTVVPEQEMPDPAFPTVKQPNPEDPAAFALAIPLARETSASVIIATDPDCDRMGVCVLDEGGDFETLSGNQIGCLLLHHIVSQRKQQGTLPDNGAAVKSIVSTQMARAICEDYGVTLFDVLTGFKFVGEKIQEFEETGSHTFLFGFEESFGYLSGTSVRDKDAVNASLLIAEAACVCLHEGITLYERLGRIYRTYGYFIEDVRAKTYLGREGALHMARIMKTLRDKPPQSFAGENVLAVRDYLTGLRYAEGTSVPMGQDLSNVLYYELENQSWLCVRPSGTEPKIKLYGGSRDSESMANARKMVTQLMDSLEERMV